MIGASRLLLGRDLTEQPQVFRVARFDSNEQPRSNGLKRLSIIYCPLPGHQCQHLRGEIVG